jgi:dTDP-4-dehydrorhamnose reductase|tara:strand:- start:19097 stop:19969 length:873 start_codon:yes stop_codon:yes gene_type:complete
MSVLVFGYSGQVARELAWLADELKLTFVFLGREVADLSFPDKCEELILNREPSAVINAAAWTAVDAAETSEAEASVVNGEAPGAMARACAKLSIPFLHISSDYVFNGSGQYPWRPHDSVAPLGAYGRSKLLGEQLVQESGARAIILRTSWVFSAHGSNFVKTMLRLGGERSHLDVVDDQVGGPTSARSIARSAVVLIEALLRGDIGGIFHFSGSPDVSWAEFARAIMDLAELPCEIRPILTAEYPTAAPRPLNSRMECQSLLEVHGIARPTWTLDLEHIITELKEKSDAT